MTAIRVEDVHKTYGKGARAVHALRGVSLTVAPGEIYGLLGRNGAGKTTLVKILLDLVRAQRGEARLLDRSSRDPHARRAVGYLPEDHRFPDYQTPESALRFYAALSGADPRAVRDAIPRLLDQVDLTSAAKKKVRSFSKGMKQRLGLAQALVHDPQILFLDEPTDGIDPVGRAEIRRLLEDQRARGRTIFLNSHLLGEVELICDRVGILSDGQLVREGTIEQLTSAEAVFDLRTDPELDADAIEAVRRRSTSLEVHVGGRLEIGVAQLEDIDAIVDELRARRVGIRHLTGKRMTLEEVFLEAVDRPQEATP